MTRIPTRHFSHSPESTTVLGGDQKYYLQCGYSRFEFRSRVFLFDSRVVTCIIFKPNLTLFYCKIVRSNDISFFCNAVLYTRSSSQPSKIASKSNSFHLLGGAMLVISTPAVTEGGTSRSVKRVTQLHLTSRLFFVENKSQLKLAATGKLHPCWASKTENNLVTHPARPRCR